MSRSLYAVGLTLNEKSKTMNTERSVLLSKKKNVRYLFIEEGPTKAK